MPDDVIKLIEGKDLVNDSLAIIRGAIENHSFPSLSRMTLVGHLRSLFKGQLAMMRHFGYPLGIIEELADMEDYTISQAMKKEFGCDRMPFLPVVPEGQLGIQEQLSCIRLDGWFGSSSLKLQGVIHLTRTSRHPYYIYDVDCSGVLNATKDYSRRGLTLPEVISLAVLVGVSKRDYIPSASRYLSSSGQSEWLRLAKFDFPQGWGSEVILGVCQGLETRDCVPSCRYSLFKGI